MSATTVTVVIAVRDGERYLAETLDSILRQHPSPTEIVVVDDGSTDSTPDLLAGYGEVLRVLRQPGAGPATALNRGVAAATGDVVAFCDADDLWEPGKQRRQLDALDADPGASIAGGLVVEFLSPDAAQLAGRLRVEAEPRRTRLLAALCVRRATLADVGPFDESLRHGFNIDWMSRADVAGHRIAWVDDVVMHRRIHAGNMGHETERARADLLRVMRLDRARRRAKDAS